jgi:hypothetical protein
MEEPARFHPLTDPIIGRLLGRAPPPDGATPEIVRWSGLIGPSAKGDEYTRLYYVDDLGVYADVKNDDILAFHPEDPEQVTYPDGTSLYVNREATALVHCPHAQWILGRIVHQLAAFVTHGHCQHPPFSSLY